MAGVRKRADLVFAPARVAVFVDGCFWHGCPDHGTWPRTHASWWRAKIGANRRRDLDTDDFLVRSGWAVYRIWAHEDAEVAASRIAKGLRRRARRPDRVRPSAPARS